MKDDSAAHDRENNYQVYSENPDSHALPAPKLSQNSRSIRISRDEMNLAEFPLTVLSKRSDPNLKTLEFKDSIRGKNGELINRSWIITGADKFGLPTSSDDEVLLGLLKLTADEGLSSRKVYFTRYELLRILRWSTEGRSYMRLQNALDRLSGVRIKASNAFYDNQAKLHSTKNFGIVDEYEINDGRNTRPSFFVWSDVLFNSFQGGFIKKLDLDFYLDLTSAVSKRLFRYLDKHFWYKSRVQMNLFTLAHEKIGVSRNFAYASSIKQQLEPALSELKEKGLIGGHEYAGKGTATEIVIFAAQGPRCENKKNAYSVSDQSDAKNQKDFQPSSLSSRIIEELKARGIHTRQSEKLCVGKTDPELQRIQEIIQYFDFLIQNNSKLVSKSPQGFLYRAVENPENFVLPQDKKKGFQQASFALKERKLVADEFAKNQEIALSKARAEYLVERKKEFEIQKGTKNAGEIKKIREYIEHQLRNMRSLLSPKSFSEAVEVGIEGELLKSYPEFDKWYRERKVGIRQVS